MTESKDEGKDKQDSEEGESCNSYIDDNLS